MSNPSLPAKLHDAELLMQKSVIDILSQENNKLISTNLAFENIKLNPIVYRLQDRLKVNGYSSYLLWADTGASALAKRDMPDIKSSIFSFSEFNKFIQNDYEERLLIAISPQPYDYESFNEICLKYSSKVIMLNGRLEDTAVGIGTTGRERRKTFIYSWKLAFYLQPLDKGALIKEFNQSWHLFRLDLDGYRYCSSFNNRPDEESINLELNK